MGNPKKKAAKEDSLPNYVCLMDMMLGNSIPRMINSSAHATKSAVIKQKSGAWIR